MPRRSEQTQGASGESEQARRRPHHLKDVIDRFPYHPGARQLRALLEIKGGPTRSEWEDAFPAFCKQYGLPEPVMSTMVAGHEADALFPDEKLIIELDGATHSTAAELALESVPNARVTLESGFTTVRDVGTYRALGDVALRDAINRGDIVGPRMFVAGAYVTITGGAGADTGLAPDITLPWDMHSGEANSSWEVRKVIRQLAHDGVDHIKVLSSGAVLTHGSNPKSQEFTLEELQAAVDEAGHFGLRVESHAHSPQGIKNAILAGVASVEHATMIDDDGIALARQHGTYLDMDIYDEECIQEEGRLGKMPKDFLEHDAQLGQIQRDNFRKAVAAGAKMSFGTDAGVCPYGTSGKQFAFMVKYGMTPMQAIQSATSNAADLLGQSDNLGSVAPHHFADLIAVEGDPLADIGAAVNNVRGVMKGGKVLTLAIPHGASTNE